MPLPKVDVGSPKGPLRRHGADLLSWARLQLKIAAEIVDNPGGGLLFATQTLGQVRASLVDEDAEVYAAAAALLRRAEDSAIHRDYAAARAAISEALGKL